MNLRIAKKIFFTEYGAHVYTAGQRKEARRRYLRWRLRNWTTREERAEVKTSAGT